LLTAYTSLMAIHNTVRPTTGATRDVEQPLPLPHGVSNLAVGNHNVPEPELGAMLVLFSVTALLWMLHRRKQRHGHSPLCS
jgi:Ca-activated chloride channel homolog